jgi:hypothetical protein
VTTVAGSYIGPDLDRDGPAWAHASSVAKVSVTIKGVRTTSSFICVAYRFLI